MGSYTCQCEHGWIFNETSFECDDFDECKSEGIVLSLIHSPILNLFLSLIEIFEKVVDTKEGPVCEDKSMCVNTPGSYTCDCKDGLTFNETSNACDDVDECEFQGICEEDSTCINTYGTYECECHIGFANVNSKECEDVDECDQYPCDIQAQCTNTVRIVNRVFCVYQFSLSLFRTLFFLEFKTDYSSWNLTKVEFMAQVLK